MNTTLPNYDAWKTREPENYGSVRCTNCSDTREEHHDVVIDGKEYTICPSTWELIVNGDGKFSDDN